MKVEINELVSYTEVHGDIVLANMETGLYFSIGGTGNQIWEALVEGNEVESIINALAGRYQVKKHCVSRDVHEFLHEMECDKFIQRNSVSSYYSYCSFSCRVTLPQKGTRPGVSP